MNKVRNILLLLIIFNTVLASDVFAQKDTGTASYYGPRFHGKTMANGKPFDQHQFTAASNKLSLGTFVRVRNLRNKKTVIVEITDRMHHRNKRLIDVSMGAAKELGFIKHGLIRVETEIVDKPDINQQ